MGGDFKRHRVIIESDQSKRRPAWNEWKEGNGVIRVPKKLKVKHTKPTSGLSVLLFGAEVDAKKKFLGQQQQ